MSTDTLTVTRETVETYDANGDLVPGVSSTFVIVAAVQPLTGNDLQPLPEGQHAENMRKLYTTTLLRTRGAGPPDAVAIDGETWEVKIVERWKHRTGDIYYKVMIARQDNP